MTLNLKVPTFQGEGPFGMPVSGPFSITPFQGQPPSVALTVTAQTGATETMPFQLLISGKHIAELAMLMLQYVHKSNIELPAMPGARTGWQTATAEDGSKIRLRVLQTTGLQVDLDMTPEDAMKLRDELDQRCKDWKKEFAH